MSVEITDVLAAIDAETTDLMERALDDIDRIIVAQTGECIANAVRERFGIAKVSGI